MSYTFPSGGNVIFELLLYQVPSGGSVLFDLNEQGSSSNVIYEFRGGNKLTFYSADMSSAVFTMSLAENQTFPLSNLHSNLRLLFWRPSASTSNQTLNVDLGSAKECDFLSIGSHNFLEIPGASFQYAMTDDGNFGDPITAVEVGRSDLNVFTFNKVTKRYWRIIFSNCSGTTPQVGMLHLGKSMMFPFSYNLDAEVGNKQYSTTVKEAPNGTIRTSQKSNGRKRLEISFSSIDDASKSAWLLMMEKIKGRLSPFFFKDNNDVLHLVHFEDDYIPVKGVRKNVNELARLKMCEQIAA
jgi:hypothetical protein